MNEETKIDCTSAQFIVVVEQEDIISHIAQEDFACSVMPQRLINLRISVVGTQWSDKVTYHVLSKLVSSWLYPFFKMDVHFNGD